MVITAEIKGNRYNIEDLDNMLKDVVKLIHINVQQYYDIEEIKKIITQS